MPAGDFYALAAAILVLEVIFVACALYCAWGVAARAARSIARRLREDNSSRRRYLVRGLGIAAKSAVRNAIRRLRFVNPAPPTDPDIEGQTSALVRIRRLRLSKSMSLAAWIGDAAICSFIAIQIFTGGVFHVDMSLIHVVAFGIFTVVNLVPCVFGTRLTMPALHIFVMAELCVVTTFSSVNELGYLASAIIHVASGAAAMLYFHFEVILLSNAVLFGFIVAAMVRDGDVALHIQGRFAAELVGSVLKLAVFFGLHRFLKSSSRNSVEEQVGKCHQSAVMSLLELSCDVVVDIDKDGALKQHFPKLAAMLMHGTGRSLRSEPFASFIAEADRGKVEQAMQCAVVEDGAAPEPSVCTVHLRDSIGNTFGVALYHVPYITIAGHVHHLVGVREESDGDAAHLREPVGFNNMKPRRSRARSATAPMALTQTYVRSVSPTLDRRSSVGSLGSLASMNSTAASTDTSSNGTDASESSAVKVHPLGVSMRRSSTSSSSSERGFRLSSVQPPCENMRVSVYVGTGLVVKHAPHELLNDLRLNTARFKRFGDFFSDDGQGLLASIEDLLLGLRHASEEGEVAWCFGEVELLPARLGPAVLARREVWVFVTVPLPMLTPGGVYEVSIGLSRGISTRMLSHGRLSGILPSEVPKAQRVW